MNDCACVPAPGSPKYAPDEIIIYGVNLRNAADQGELAVKSDWSLTLAPKTWKGSTAFEIVAAYGYAYEGHCYRFDRPRILVFTRKGKDAEPEDAVGCGFNAAPGLGYKMWRVPSDENVMELTAQIDTFRTLILESNLPGRRPPNTYASEMQLAHRGGRLTGTGV